MITSPLPWSYRILTEASFNGEGPAQALLLDNNGLVIGVIHDTNNAELILETLRKTAKLEEEITRLEIELYRQ